MQHEDHSVTLREIAGQLQAAADALEAMAGRCGCPSGSQASPGPWVELFARRHRLGWDVFGDESANTATLEVLA